ncbi:hypothetical protein NKH47_24470 [Mesorhizobium sp. M1060]|uniref:hypothetical protein n=1 Tax=Mesorhizobium sp. M1060 TaxID=2957052 RepID=UPI003335024B
MPISPSLNRAVVDRYQDPRAAQPDTVLTDLAGAVEAAGQAAAEIEATAAVIAADKSKSAGENSIRIRAAATGTGTRGVARLDSALERARAEVARLIGATWSPRPPATAAEESRAAELRGVLRTMRPEDRAKAIADRLNADDDRFLSAVLNADALTTSMSTSELDALRARWRRQRFPTEVDRIARLQKAAEASQRAGLAFVEVVTRHTDSQAAKLADHAAARAAEAIAAAASHQA